MNNKLIDVKIVGKGCDKYFELLHMVQNILSVGNKSYEIQEINDSKSIAQLKIKQMPALIVNGNIVVQGINYEKASLIKIFETSNYK